MGKGEKAKIDLSDSEARNMTYFFALRLFFWKKKIVSRYLAKVDYCIDVSYHGTKYFIIRFLERVNVGKKRCLLLCKYSTVLSTRKNSQNVNFFEQITPVVTSEAKSQIISFDFDFMTKKMGLEN